MRLYIVGPEDGGAGQYELLTSWGESLIAHTCPNVGEAAYLLVLGRPQMRAELTRRFGHWDVLTVCMLDLARELRERKLDLARELRERKAEFYRNKP